MEKLGINNMVRKKDELNSFEYFHFFNPVALHQKEKKKVDSVALPW